MTSQHIGGQTTVHNVRSVCDHLAHWHIPDTDASLMPRGWLHGMLVGFLAKLLASVTSHSDRGRSLPIPVVWKRLQRELMVFRCTSNRRATSHWGVPAWIIPMARWRASVPKRGMLSVRRQWSSVNVFFFSGTSKHSQHPCMLTRCGTRMTEAANSKWSMYHYCHGGLTNRRTWEMCRIKREK